MFKPGDLVRHRNMNEWGLGRVSGETGDGKVLIKFTGRKGDVLLSQDGAERFLVVDPTAVWTATPAARTKRPSATGRASSRSGSSRPAPVVPLMPSPFIKQPPRRIPCVNCAAPLSTVVSSPDGTWRSCPSCSSRSGRHHVFLPYPAAFEVEAESPLTQPEASAAQAEPSAAQPAADSQASAATAGAGMEPVASALGQVASATPQVSAASSSANGDAAHGDAADDTDAASAEPEDPQAGWCLACRAGELATGYKTCMKVL